MTTLSCCICAFRRAILFAVVCCFNFEIAFTRGISAFSVNLTVCIHIKNGKAIEEKIKQIASKIYGASNVEFSEEAKQTIKKIKSIMKI